MQGLGRGRDYFVRLDIKRAHAQEQGREEDSHDDGWRRFALYRGRGKGEVRPAMREGVKVNIHGSKSGLRARANHVVYLCVYHEEEGAEATESRAQ